MLRIGKDINCDLRIDPPKKDENAISDLHCIIGYEYVEHAENQKIPDPDEDKIQNKKRTKDC